MKGGARTGAALAAGRLNKAALKNAPHKTKARLQQSGSVNYGRSVSQTVLAGEAGVGAAQARKLSVPVRSPGGMAPRAAKAALRVANPSSSGKSCRRVMKRMIDVVS